MRNLFLLFSLIGCLNLFAQNAPTREGAVQIPDDLKILSWNIYMLPSIVPMAGRLERARAIVDTLPKSDYDIIVFQEAFHKGAVKIIREGLQKDFPYMYGPFNDTEKLLRFNSGVWVISKQPLKVVGTVQFPAGRGSDHYAQKGAALLEGTLNGKTFQILGTHMQAENYPEIRKQQFDIMYKDLLSINKKEGVPQIICGDMNTENLIKEEYCNMLECLDAENGSIEGLQKDSYDGLSNELASSVWKKAKTTLDYILLRKNGAEVVTMNRKVSVLRKHWKKGKKDLSDHFGVICQVKF